VRYAVVTAGFNAKKLSFVKLSCVLVDIMPIVRDVSYETRLHSLRITILAISLRIPILILYRLAEKKLFFSIIPLSFDATLRRTLANIHTKFIFPETRVPAVHFTVDSVRLSSCMFHSGGPMLIK